MCVTSSIIVYVTNAAIFTHSFSLICVHLNPLFGHTINVTKQNFFALEFHHFWICLLGKLTLPPSSRFLSTSSSFSTTASSFCPGVSTLVDLGKDTCDVIWAVGTSEGNPCADARWVALMEHCREVPRKMEFPKLYGCIYLQALPYRHHFKGLSGVLLW